MTASNQDRWKPFKVRYTTGGRDVIDEAMLAREVRSAQWLVVLPEVCVSQTGQCVIDGAQANVCLACWANSRPTDFVALRRRAVDNVPLLTDLTKLKTLVDVM
jgi:hypothetical protein